MKDIAGNRWSGKTTQALKLAQKTGAILLVGNAGYARDLAKHLDIKDVAILPYFRRDEDVHEGEENLAKSFGHHKYVIDDIDAFVRHILHNFVDPRGSIVGFTFTEYDDITGDEE